MMRKPSVHEKQTSKHQAPLHSFQCFVTGLGDIENGPLSSLCHSCAYSTLAGIDWHQFPLFMWIASVNCSMILSNIHVNMSVCESC